MPSLKLELQIEFRDSQTQLNWMDADQTWCCPGWVTLMLGERHKCILKAFPGVPGTWEWSSFQFFWGNMVHMGKQLTNSFMIDPSIHLPPVLSHGWTLFRGCVCEPGRLWQCEAVIGFQQQNTCHLHGNPRRIHLGDLSASSFSFFFFFKSNKGTSLVVHWLILSLPNQGVWVQSLLEELRSYIPCGHKSKTQKRSDIVTNPIEFKNDQHKKSLKK